MVFGPWCMRSPIRLHSAPSWQLAPSAQGLPSLLGALTQVNVLFDVDAQVRLWHSATSPVQITGVPFLQAPPSQTLPEPHSALEAQAAAARAVQGGVSQEE